MAQWRTLKSAGVALACSDFGGAGTSVLMLHGLAGHSGEWAPTAAVLGNGFRLAALDQRGHGRSEREPGDLSRSAYVGDVAAVVDELSLAPVVLLGHSMGGNTAFLAAAAFPEKVRALVVVEASPDGPVPELPEQIRRWLESWPVPFIDDDDAREFFSSQGLSPVAWIDGLERRPDGMWPSFSIEVMVGCMTELAARDYWTEWRQVQCPTLIVRGEDGYLPADHARELAQALPDGELITIANAGHDVHLDAPERLADEVRRFLG